MSRDVARSDAHASRRGGKELATTSVLQVLLEQSTAPGVISFALGLPASESIPRDEIGAAAQRILRNDTDALQYGPPSLALRRHIVRLMKDRGVDCHEGQVFITAGAQQGMNLITRLLLRPGCAIVTEEYVYPGFQQAVQYSAPRYCTVPTESDGIDVDSVEVAVRTHKPALVYVMPDGHNPLGVTMSRSKRERLIEISRAYEVPIVEDDVYGFLTYQVRPESSLRSMGSERVFYVSSFSKILAPAARVGWVVAPEHMMPTLSALKEAMDIDTATFMQRVVASVLDTDLWSTQLVRTKRIHQARRDTMMAALDAHWSGYGRWSRPNSGLFVWLELDPATDTTELLRRALEECHVAFVPAEAFCVPGGPRHRSGLRLNFSRATDSSIHEGISRLARLAANTCGT